MDSKEKPVFQFYQGIWSFFLLGSVFAVMNNSFYLNSAGKIVFLVVICIPIAMFLDSLMQLKGNGMNISLKRLQSNKIKLVPMMAGFVLNLIGIYVLSITHQVINPNGSPTGSVLHPLVSKA